MLTTAEKENLKATLAQFDNVGDMVLYIQKTYDLKQGKPSFITKGKYIDGLVQIVNALNLPKK